MAYDPKVYRRAMARLEERKTRREEENARRRKEIYEALPRVRDIDRQLQDTVRQVILSALNRGADPAPAVKVLRERNLDLQAERAELLRAHGYPIDALDDVPYCKNCGDTGWNGAKMCPCLKLLCQEEQNKELSSMLSLQDQSFDTFDLERYSPQPWPSQPLSPRENMELIRDTCYHYANRFRHTGLRNLFFHGAPGLGKTFLSACIAREVSNQGYSVVYDTAVHIFAQMEAQKFDRDEEAEVSARRYLKCDLLLLDDLGTEVTTPFVQSALYTIVNTRLLEDKCTVISTNLSMKQIRDRYSAQVASRLEGEYHSMFFYGHDIRQQRPKQF